VRRTSSALFNNWKKEGDPHKPEITIVPEIATGQMVLETKQLKYLIVCATTPHTRNNTLLV